MGGVKEGKILNPDKRLLEACEQLRHAVEHPNEQSDIILQQGVYRQKDPEAIMTVKVDGVEVGYKVKPCSRIEMDPYFDRYAYLKVPGHRLVDLSSEEFKAIKAALFEAFFEPQQGKINVELIGWDALLMWQRFQVAFPIERNKNLVSIAGGFDVCQNQ